MAEPAEDRIDPILRYVQSMHPDRDTAVKAVAMRLRRAAHYVDTQIVRLLGPAGIDIWEMELLATVLRRGGSTTIGKLQDAAQLTAGAITHRVTRLEQAGHVTRTIDPSDRRQIVVTLTEAGQRRANEVIQANDAAQYATLERVDPVILNRLAADLREFLVAVEGHAPFEMQVPVNQQVTAEDGVSVEARVRPEDRLPVSGRTAADKSTKAKKTDARTTARASKAGTAVATARKPKR